MNLFASDIGSMHGRYTLVLRRSVMSGMVLIAPIDTGTLQSACFQFHVWNESSSLCHPTLGTLEHFWHLMAPWAKLRNQTVASVLTMFLKRRCTARKRVDVAPNLAASERYVVDYWESNVLGGMPLPGAVRFVIARLADLFGTVSGAMLRRWCVRHGLILCWAYGSGIANLPATMRSNNVVPWLDASAYVRMRLIDPTTLANSSAARNFSGGSKTRRIWGLGGGSDLEAAFGSLWTRQGLATQRLDPKELWARLTHQLSPTLALFPLTYGACADAEDCIGVSSAGTCVCYN
eukprot:CAMPEP_0115851690 /NCGR_PEP_ID=MMETSP0287-20121206/12611_1 /TAXON_ID=412157 /ORGANISM="Chrysochromulina rotalis, Strain UIO044" /LENGTH=290 /DNA_ID=CAMNT_0003305729 /DNA_START=102 /DNA_END=974 /DNA_ORIENTATION=+